MKRCLKVLVTNYAFVPNNISLQTSFIMLFANHVMVSSNSILQLRYYEQAPSSHPSYTHTL